MILSDIKRYLIERHHATLNDIALHFDSEPDAVRGMLDHWIRKGKVVKHMAGAACGSACNKCDDAATEVFEWVADGATSSAATPVKFVPDQRCHEE